jgi:hypothetical protein
MEERLKRSENEKFYTYVRKLVDGKFKDNTLTDYDHTEIYKAIYGIEVNSSEARKRMYGLRDFFANFNEEELNNITEDETLLELEAKRVEIEKERKKLQATKIEYNRNLRVESRQELLYENIRDEKERLPLPIFEERYHCDKGSEYLLAFTDVHYGADFVSENNVYNREETKKRFELIVSRTKQMCREKHISHLNICDLGDDIQGLLRISDVQINDIPVVQAVVEVARLIATTLNEISKVADITYYHTMASNHSQTRPITGKADLIKEDLEYLIGNYISDLLSENDKVKVVISDKDYHSIQLARQQVIMLHGHQVKDTKNAIRDYSMLHRVFYDIAFVGHFHAGQQMSVGESENGNTEIYVVPSFVGSDPYSDSLKKGSKAMCKLFKIEEGNGVTENYTIVLN